MMRTVGKVRKRLKQVQFKHQKKYLDLHLKRRPCNCKWNSEQRYIHEGTRQLKILGMCMYSVENPEWDTDICESVSQANTCPHFCVRTSKEELKESFEALLRDEEFVNTYCKDIAALRWVIHNDSEELNGHSRWQRLKKWMSFGFTKNKSNGKLR